MIKTLNPRQIALAARMCRIGSEPEAIAVALQASTAVIAELMRSNPDVIAGIKARQMMLSERKVSKLEAKRKPAWQPRDRQKAVVRHPVMPEAEAVVALQPESVAAVKQLIAERYKISIEVMVSSSRNKGVVAAREAAVCAVKMLWPDLTAGQIGQHFGGRVHSAIQHILSKHNLPTTVTKINQAA